MAIVFFFVVSLLSPLFVVVYYCVLAMIAVVLDRGVPFFCWCAVGLGVVYVVVVWFVFLVLFLRKFPMDLAVLAWLVLAEWWGMR